MLSGVCMAVAGVVSRSVAVTSPGSTSVAMVRA